MGIKTPVCFIALLACTLSNIVRILKLGGWRICRSTATRHYFARIYAPDLRRRHRTADEEHCVSCIRHNTSCKEG